MPVWYFVKTLYFVKGKISLEKNFYLIALVVFDLLNFLAV